MNYKTKLKHINTFIFDVDGVLTDGTVTLFGNGEQVRKMSSRDGYSLQYAKKRDIKLQLSLEVVAKVLNSVLTT